MGKDSNTIASIQHLFKIVPMQVPQHLKAHCSIMWMKLGTDLSWPRFETAREEEWKHIPTRIGNPISFCAVALKSSKVFRVAKQNVAIATSWIDIMWLRPRFETTRQEHLKQILDLLLCSSTKIKQSHRCDIQVELHKTLLKHRCSE